jgi:hypothetical protein
LRLAMPGPAPCRDTVLHDGNGIPAGRQWR